ncbi:DUF7446 family protein [Staphylococcus muscae]|uniref:Phage protein n=1 Tax=Staphylococcus muscae TaxID=1294 RepID=A0A240BXW9_9STAP|nr:hypothetical protein [Staphylococcus muscae]GGA93368.1 hypothetical protein GCM10007183_16960 [Staphylococcus muscae]SNW00637.1 phage protein [Staphylococcus muscae]
MSLQNIELVLSAITNEIYMAEIEEDGMMSIDNKREATNDVARVMAEWFVANQKTGLKFKGDGWLLWLKDNEFLAPQDIKNFTIKLNDISNLASIAQLLLIKSMESKERIDIEYHLEGIVFRHHHRAYSDYGERALFFSVNDTKEKLREKLNLAIDVINGKEFLH